MSDPHRIANDALDCQLSYYEWAKTPGRMLDSYTAFLIGSGFAASEVSGEDPFDALRRMGYTPDAIEYYGDAELRLINTARTVAVSSDMLEIAKFNGGIWWEPQAESQMLRLPDRGDLGVDDFVKEIPAGDPDWSTLGFEAEMDGGHLPVLTREMLPFTEPGFLWFETPVPFPDFDLPIINEYGPGKLPTLHVRAIGWQQVPQVATGLDEDGEAITSPGIAMIMYMDDRYDPNALHMLDFTGWGFNADYTVDHEWMSQIRNNSTLIKATPGSHSINPHVAMIRILMTSIFGIMRSSIELTRPSRQVRRRAEHAKLAFPEYGEVQVITLRTFLNRTNAHRKEPTDSSREYSHRWLVRGHWAWRHCSQANADDGEIERKRVYIDPYEKGPEDKPLIIKDKIYAVVR